jgi:hypothetical protein
MLEEEIRMIKIMEDNSGIMAMLNNDEIEPEAIINKYGNDCPSFYSLEDNMKLCNESGDGCDECWLGAMKKHREEREEKRNE